MREIYMNSVSFHKTDSK